MMSDDLCSRIVDLVIKDFTRVLDTYLELKIEVAQNGNHSDCKAVRFELSELVLKKVRLMMEAVQEGEVGRWIQYLCASKNNREEISHFRSIKKLYEKIRFISSGNEETLLDRRDIRTLSQLLIEVSLHLLRFPNASYFIVLTF